MPSHSTKQAKTMSAIAHGWKPKGSAKDIPLKVARDFHAADAGKKYGKGMKAGGLVEKAKRIAKRYARGGEIDINDIFDPTEGGQIPRSLQQMVREPPKTWKPPAQIRPPRGLRSPNEDLQDFMSRGAYADGGATDSDLPLSDPSFSERWYDRAAGAYAMPGPAPGLAKALFREGSGRENRPPDRDWSAYGSFGELKGTAPEDTPVAFKTKNPLTAITEGDIDRGLDVGMGVGPGIFVGPYGAHALRQAARAGAGDVVPPKYEPHPVYAKDVVASAKNLRPEFQEAYKGWQQDARDAAARGILDMRTASRNPIDQDVWQSSGWFRGAEGKIRKEIPDIGAKLEEIPGTNKFALNHPAGDLHKIYDIPPIEFVPGMKAGQGAFFPDSNRIVIGGNPYSKKDMAKATDVALHEIQHIIQKKEGFSGGSNPERASSRPEFMQEFFPQENPETALFFDLDNMGIGVKIKGGSALEPSWQKEKYSGMIEKAGMRDLPPEHYALRKKIAEQEAYERSGGETESRNVQARRQKTFKYLTHPENTEDIPLGLQWQEPHQKETGTKIYTPRDLKGIAESMVKGEKYHVVNPTKKAGGGGIGGFNPTVGASIGLARQGMIKSDIPGRTDKINMKVPTGSYIIPADIPSALGEGNSEAGGAILGKMMNKGPYGMNLPKRRGGMRIGKRRSSLSASMRFADGGDVENTPIVAAGGEFVVHPESVMALGGGDINLGHAILDDFVKQVREKHINTLKNLKPPKGSE